MRPITFGVSGRHSVNFPRVRECLGRARCLWRRRWTAGPAAILVVAVLAVFAGLAPAVRAQMPAGIVPGQSVGPARLGMSEIAIAAVLGPSTSQGAGRRVYPQFGIVVDYDRGVAVRIATSAAKYRTVAGAGVGSAAQDTARLVGDMNSVKTVSGQNTTIWYAFQGIGFVFREGRAIEAFVVDPVVLSPKPPAAGVPGTPGGPLIAVPRPPSATAPAAPSTGAALRDLKASVLSVGGVTVTGNVVNTGSSPIGPLTVTGLFTRASGDQIETKATIQGPLAPGGSGPFSLSATMVNDIIIRFQISVTNSAGALLATTAPENIPASAYADFARKQIHVKVELGAPSSKVGSPSVQALVSVVDTGVIPAQWVQRVSVQVPYFNGGSAQVQNAQLRPGETQTVLVPAGATLGAPFVTAVTLGGG